MSHDWKVRLWTFATSRPVGLAAGTVIFLIILGCMNISIGRHIEQHEHTCSEDGVLVQEGEVHSRHNEEQTVFYPIPYAAPPNLELTCTWDDCETLEQREDRFRVRFHLSNSVSWKAKGLRGTPPPAPAPVPAPTASTPAPVLPPPTPVEPERSGTLPPAPVPVPTP